MPDETSPPGDLSQVRLQVPRLTIEYIDDLTVLLGMPRQAVVRAVLNLGLEEFTKRWHLVYYNLLDELAKLREKRRPIENPTPLDVELDRVMNPAGPEIESLTS